MMWRVLVKITSDYRLHMMIMEGKMSGLRPKKRMRDLLVMTVFQVFWIENRSIYSKLIVFENKGRYCCVNVVETKNQ